MDAVKFWEGIANLFDIDQENAGILEGDNNDQINYTKLLTQVKNGVKAKVKEVAKDKSEEHYSRGKKETAKEWESKIKELFGLESSTIGFDLLTEAKAAISDGGNAPDNITAEELRKLPIFNETLKEEVKKLNESFDEERNSFTQKIASLEQGELKRFAQSTALAILEAANFNFGEQETRTTRINTINQLIDYNRLKVEGKEIIMLDEEGNPAKDDLHKPILYKDHVLKIGSAWGYNAANPDNGTPSHTGQSSSSGSSLKITSQDEYDAYVRNNPDKKTEALRAYREYVDSQ